MEGYDHTDVPATAAENTSNYDKLFTCGICFGYYKTPRYLPTCGHTFCENCLLKYAQNIQQKCQGSKFVCPVCRKPNNLPEHGELTLQWVQTFPLNTVITNTMETLPHSSEYRNDTRRMCDPCRQEREANVALKFCFDCNEGLCETCTTYHRKVKLTKDHILIDITKMSAEAICTDFFSDVRKCDVHPGRDVEFYCKSHDDVICSLCSTFQHSACEMTEINDHGLSVTNPQNDTGALITEMKTAVEYLQHLQIVKAKTNNSVQQKLIKIRENSEQVRAKVVKLMDSVVSHVSEVTQQIEMEQDADASRLSNIKEDLERNISLLDTIEQHGSDRHKFVTAHIVMKQFDETSKQILVCEEDTCLKQLDTELVLADILKKIIESTDVEKLVQIKITESEINQTPLASGSTSPLGDTRAVLDTLTDSMLVKAEEHTVCPDTGRVAWYYGVSVYRDGRVILCDNNTGGYLHLYNPTNRTELKLMLEGPNCAVQIDDTHLAVSIPAKKTISIVTVGNDLREEKTFDTEHEPHTIVALNHGQLAVAWDPPAFSIIDISGTELVQKSYLVQDTSGRMFETFQYLAVDERRQHVIQPCFIDTAVHCFDFTGKPIFKYTNPLLTYPQGVALDKCDNIYVCEFDFVGSIHKLSPTGNLITIITEGVPQFPLDICSDVTGTGFWVTQDTSPGDEIVYFKLETNAVMDS